MILVVDTHPFVWFLAQSPQLGLVAKEALLDTANTIIIPSIVLAETQYLYWKKRISLSLSDIHGVIDEDERCNIYPLDETVVDYLPETLDIHDGIICATALALKDALDTEIRLITKDEEIIRSGLAKTIW